MHYDLKWVSVNKEGRGGIGGHTVKFLKWAKGTSYYCVRILTG